jgi:hypothetical protein
MFALIYNIVYIGYSVLYIGYTGVFQLFGALVFLFNTFSVASQCIERSGEEDKRLRNWYNSSFGSYEDEKRLLELNRNNTRSHLLSMYNSSKNEDHFVKKCKNNWSFTDSDY